MFSAEQIVEKGRNFHQSCFTCKHCKKYLNDKLQVFVHEEEVYCKTCYPKVSYKPLNLMTSTSLIKGSQSESCPRCEGKVFEAEKIQTRKYIFHKSCFCCKQCKHILDYSNMYESKEGEVFCKPCYLNLFFTNGKNKYLEKNPLPATEGATACLKCGFKVFDVEKVLTKHGDFHISCLSCNNCLKTLTTANYFLGSDKSMFCKNCYDALHGRRSRSRSRGPVNVSAFQADLADPNQCEGCHGKIFEAEKFSTCFGLFHASCYRCTKCSISLHTSQNSACSRNGMVLCRQCYGRERSKSLIAGHDEDGSLIFAKSIVESQTIPADDGDPFKCPRCSGKVFEAEKMKMKSGCYHKKCFSCIECCRPLNYSLATDGPNLQLYCTTCYSKNFGPQTFKTDVEALYKTQSCQPSDGSGCPNCGGAVFEAEKNMLNGKAYHLKCTKCALCSTRLTPGSVCNGADGFIYCTGCYSRLFGSSTYRGAMTQNWVDGNQKVKKVFKTNGLMDPNVCNRCQEKVFERERISSSTGVWHKFCFYCNGCRTTLSPASAAAFKSPDKQIYCNSCYFQAFGEGTIPESYTDNSKIKQSCDGDSCTRCMETVYEAERIRISENVIFHKYCFTCAGCRTNLDTLKVFLGQNDDAYCKSCYTMMLATCKPNIDKSTDILKADPNEQNGCPRCEGKVFEAEKLQTKYHLYHKACFSCSLCSHKLDASTFIEGQHGEIFCKTCYQRDVNSNTRHAYLEKKDVKANESEKNCCLKCQNKVFVVDQIIIGNGVYHNYCLRCFNCQASLSRSSLFTGPQSKIFCKNCYNNQYGVRGRAGSVSRKEFNETEFEANLDPNRCRRCSGKVFAAEKMLTSNGLFHKECFTCYLCSCNLSPNSCNAGPNGEIFCQYCYKEEYGIYSRRPRSRSRSCPGSRNQVQSPENSLFNLDSNEGHQIITKVTISLHFTN